MKLIYKIIYSKAFTEVNIILNQAGEELINKVPEKLLELIKNNEDKNYQVNISEEISYEEQNLMEETKNILALIYRKYWCNEEERKAYDEILKKNQIIKELEEKVNALEQKNIEKVDASIKFNNINTVENITEVPESEMKNDLQIAKMEKESLFAKIKNKLKILLR